MKRLFRYWVEFREDFRIWRRFRKAARKQEDILIKNNMRVDWLGRVYTVINMPEEVINNQEMVQQGWVIGQLKPFNEILLQIGIADFAYPEISRVPNSNSYLIVMYPEIDTLNPWRMLWNVSVTGVLVGLGYVGVNALIAADVVASVKGLF